MTEPTEHAGRYAHILITSNPIATVVISTESPEATRDLAGQYKTALEERFSRPVREVGFEFNDGVEGVEKLTRSLAHQNGVIYIESDQEARRRITSEDAPYAIYSINPKLLLPGFLCDHIIENQEKFTSSTSFPSRQHLSR
jgi:hypothetical protein